MKLQNQKGIVNTAIIALVIGLILLSAGIYLSMAKSKPSTFVPVKRVETSNMVNTATTPVPTTKVATPNKQVVKTPVSNAEIDRQLQQLTSDEKNMTNTLSDTPIDVMAQ